MSDTFTWEYIVQAQPPPLLSDLEIIITEGEPLNIGFRRPDLYEEVLDYWNQAQVRQTMVRANDLADALDANDEAKVSRMQRQIGGVNQKNRLSRATMRGNKLFLAMNSTTYMDFVGTNERSINDAAFRERLMQAGIEDYADAERYFASPMAVCAVVYGYDTPKRTEESIYVPITLRSDKVMIYPNVHHVFGGLVDVDEKRSRLNLASHLLRELREEIGLKDEEMGQPLFYGIIRQRPSRIPEAILSIPVFVSKDELEQRWQNHAPGKYEHRNITFYRFNELELFLEKYEQSMVPSGAAALHNFIQQMKSAPQVKST